MSSAHPLHERKDRARDVDEPEHVGLEQLPGGVDEYIDATKAIAGLRNGALSLFVPRDVKLDDDRLGRITLDQVAHALRLTSRDDRSLATSQYRLRERPANAVRGPGHKPDTVVARGPTLLVHLHD